MKTLRTYSKQYLLKMPVEKLEQHYSNFVQKSDSYKDTMETILESKRKGLIEKYEKV